MSAAWERRKLKQRRRAAQLSDSMLVCGASSASAGYWNPSASASYESNDSDFTDTDESADTRRQEYTSARSLEHQAIRSMEPQSARSLEPRRRAPSRPQQPEEPFSWLAQRPRTTSTATAAAQFSDRKLETLATAAANGVDWQRLELELAEGCSASNTAERLWKRKKMRSRDGSDTLRVFTRRSGVSSHPLHHRQEYQHLYDYGAEFLDRRARRRPKGYAVLAQDILPCSAQELRLVFRMFSTDAFRDVMRCVYRREFVEGELLRRTELSGDGEALQDDGNLRGKVKPAVKPKRSSGAACDATELFVKTASFESSGLFAKTDEWCFVELLRPLLEAPEAITASSSASRSTTGTNATAPAFTRTLVSVPRTRVLGGGNNFVSRQVQEETPGMVVSYAFREEQSGLATRVLFHGEYAPAEGFAGHNQNQERRIMRSRLLRLAAGCRRFLLVVRRRRLGMQVIINSTRLPMASITATPRCACCRRVFASFFFGRAKKRLCCLCGFLVCDKCAHAQEREHRARGDARPQIEQVRVCERCLVRVDQCRFTAATEEDLRPARVVPDRLTPTSAAGGSTPNGTTQPKARAASLNDLLLETLADTTGDTESKRRRKTSVLSLMRDLVDEEARSRKRGSSGSTSQSSTSHGLPLLAEEQPNEGDSSGDEREQGDACQLKHTVEGPRPAWEDDAFQLANADSRTYTLTFPEEPDATMEAPIGPGEAKRLQLIREQQLDELGDVPELGIICNLAARELKCAVSMVTVVAEEELRVLASTHPAVPGGAGYPRAQGFCSQTILDTRPLVSRHVQADVRFASMKQVRGMGINFYCGFPLLGPDGSTVIGSVCCADPTARDLTQSQYATMNSLATTAARVVQRAAERRAVREVSNEE